MTQCCCQDGFQMTMRVFDIKYDTTRKYTAAGVNTWWQDFDILTAFYTAGIPARGTVGSAVPDFGAQCVAVAPDDTIWTMGARNATYADSSLVQMDVNGFVVGGFDPGVIPSGVGLQIDSSGNFYLISGSSTSSKLHKFDSAGVEQWTYTPGFNITKFDVNDDGYAIIGGVANLDGFGDPVAPNIACVDGSGSPVWTALWNDDAIGGPGVSGSTNQVYSVVSAGGGDAWVAGTFRPVFLSGHGWEMIRFYDNTGATDYSVPGDAIWATNSYVLTITKMVLDSSGNFIVICGDTTLGDAGQKVVKFDSAGVLQWKATHPGTGATWRDVAIDSSDNIVCCGTRDDGDAGASDHPERSKTLKKYDPSGTLLWSGTNNEFANTVTGSNLGQMNRLAIDSDDNIFTVSADRIYRNEIESITINPP